MIDKENKSVDFYSKKGPEAANFVSEFGHLLTTWCVCTFFKKISIFEVDIFQVNTKDFLGQNPTLFKKSFPLEKVKNTFFN